MGNERKEGGGEWRGNSEGDEFGQEEMRRGEMGIKKKGGGKDEGNEMRERWMEGESDDQVLVGLMRDAHICSRSSMIFTQSLCQ